MSWKSYYELLVQYEGDWDKVPELMKKFLASRDGKHVEQNLDLARAAYELDKRK